jgi:HlyD family secretion protein
MATDRKPRRLKWLIILILLIAGAGAAVWYWGSDHTPPPEYQTATVTRGDLVQLVTASGTLNPVLNVQVGSQISGNIQKLFADFNSLVKSNQVVAQLDAAVYQAIVHQTEADLANTKAALELAQVEANRSASLFKDHLVSESDNQKAMADLHQAEAQVKMKEASVEKAKVDLGHCTIYAPVDGIVISRNVDVGQTVAASMNAPVLFIIANDLAKMQIDASVSEADVGSVEDGQSANFTVDAFSGRTFVGKVSQIRNSPITVQNVVSYDTVIDVNNKDLKLKPGMTATVSLTTAQRNGVLKVPNFAFRFKPPEPVTNQPLVARLLLKLGFGASKAASNAPPAITSSGSNHVASAAGGNPPLTGNEPPEELARRVREMRDRGEELPPEIRARLRELYQSGALQRPGGGGPGGPGGGGGGTAPRPRPAGPATRTLYTLVMEKAANGGEPVAVAKPVRVKTGISDGSSTEILDGLKEGDVVITSIKTTRASAAAPSPGASPFGGGGGRRGF